MRASGGGRRVRSQTIPWVSTWGYTGERVGHCEELEVSGEGLGIAE